LGCVNPIRSRHLALFIVLAPVVATSVVGAGDAWRSAILERHSSLLACVIPSALSAKRQHSAPTTRLVDVVTVWNPVVNDGCGVTVYQAESGQVFLSVTGGLPGTIRYWLGPFEPNPDQL